MQAALAELGPYCQPPQLQAAYTRVTSGNPYVQHSRCVSWAPAKLTRCFKAFPVQQDSAVLVAICLLALADETDGACLVKAKNGLKTQPATGRFTTSFASVH